MHLILNLFCSSDRCLTTLWLSCSYCGRWGEKIWIYDPQSSWDTTTCTVAVHDLRENKSICKYRVKEKWQEREAHSGQVKRKKGMRGSGGQLQGYNWTENTPISNSFVFKGWNGPASHTNLEPDCRSRACSHMNTNPLILSLGTDECGVVDHVFRILQGKTGASNGCGTPETQYM